MLDPILLGLSLWAFSAEPPVPPSPLEIELDCQPALAPGRVRCQVKLRTRPEMRLAWADVLVVAAPEFARPLRSRVLASPGPDGEGQAALALFASRRGSGELRVRGRAVLCAESDESSCYPVIREARLNLQIGR